MVKEDRLITALEAANILGYKSRVSWYEQLKKDPEAPKPAIVGNKFTRWRHSDVMAYMELRIARYQASINAPRCDAQDALYQPA